MENFECRNRNLFCLVCSLYTPSSHSKEISPNIKSAYQKYFRRFFPENEWYIPEIVCEYCYKRLLEFERGDTSHRMKYVHPTLWMSELEHNPDSCYFCVSKKNAVGFHYKTRERISYAASESVMKPQAHIDEIETGLAIGLANEFSEATTSGNVDEATTSEYVPPTSTPEKAQHLITQQDYSDLCRDLDLTGNKAELLGSRLKQWNLIAPDFKISAFRKREHATDFDRCFSYHEERKIAYCNDIEELFKAKKCLKRSA